MSEVSTYCFDCGVVAVPERGMIRHADGCSKQASNPPSSPVETTAGSEQRPDHTGVIRVGDAVRTNVMLRAIVRGMSRKGDYIRFTTRLAVAEAVLQIADSERDALEAKLAERDTEVAELKADHSATFREGMLGIREGTAAVLHVMAERSKALALVADLQTGLMNALADVTRLTKERDDARANLACVLDVHAQIALRRRP